LESIKNINFEIPLKSLFVASSLGITATSIILRWDKFKEFPFLSKIIECFLIFAILLFLFGSDIYLEKGCALLVLLGIICLTFSYASIGAIVLYFIILKSPIKKLSDFAQNIIKEHQSLDY
jgi:hypothetical protein